MIAAVHGYCLAGGFEIALSCDIRICSEEATFGLPEIKRGFFPGSSGTVRLPRVVPLGMALEMLYTGEAISAAEAFRCGLVNRVVPRDGLMAEAEKLARSIADGPPLALQAVKEVVLRGLDLPLARRHPLRGRLPCHGRRHRRRRRGPPEPSARNANPATRGVSGSCRHWLGDAVTRERIHHVPGPPGVPRHP